MKGLLFAIANQLGMTTLSFTSYIISDPGFTNCRGSVHHWTDIPLIKMFNKKNRYPSIDISHTIYPPDHIHSVFHWKELSLLIQKTESAENLSSYEAQNNLNPVNHKNNIIKLFDAHFHLDMYLKEVRYSGLPSFILKKEDVELQLLITNYCSPPPQLAN
jgi:hypothetical protein